MVPSVAEEIASAAARLVVDEGLEYAQAKRKALRQLGRPTRGSELPSNELVEDEVRSYLQLFRADSQPAELRALRELALRWMQRLAEFRPHLGARSGAAPRRGCRRSTSTCTATTRRLPRSRSSTWAWTTMWRAGTARCPT